MAKVINENIVRDFVKALKAERKKPSAYDTTAKVLRVDGDTAWVHIAGGVDETPVKLTVNAQQGDTVQIRVGGGKAWIVGNETAPPTDDAKANEADAKAVVAKEEAGVAKAEATEAKETAEEVHGIAVQAQENAAEAKTIADDTAQYFWVEEEGTDTGAHITEVPQEEWNDNTSPNYHKGGNLLARANGIAVRDGMVELASFGATGARVGKTDGARTVVGDGSTTIYTPDNVPAFDVSSGSGSSQQTVVIELGHDFDIENKNTPVFKTHTEFNRIPNGTSFAVKFVYGEADDVTNITFIKGTSSTASYTFSGTGTATISFAYNGSNQITYTWTGGTATGPISLWPHSATYVATVYDAVVDAPYGYSSNGAQIGSFINISSYAGDQIQLTTSDQYLTLAETIDKKGNAFAVDDTNGCIECLKSGIVLFSATIRLYSSFNAQDIIGYGLTNDTQSTTFNNAQFRVPPNMTSPNQNVFTPAMPVTVLAGDKIRVRIRNATGSRGMINLDTTFLSATYLAPLLT